MAITPAGKRRAQVSQGGFKHESIFDDNVNQLLRKLSATGTSVEEPQAGIDQQLQDATASPQLTDPARNVPEMETKQQTQPAGQAGQAVQGQQPDQQYPVMPGSMESLPPTQRAVAELLIQKAKNVSRTNAALDKLSEAWANDAIRDAKVLFAGTQFSAATPSPRGNSWSIGLPLAYEKTMASLKEDALARAGAHLAQVLQTIWPE